jgi:hypothetical protein
LLQRLGMNASLLVWRDPDGIGRHRASWPLDPERAFHEHLFSSLERLVDRHSSRRYADASIQSLLAGIWRAWVNPRMIVHNCSIAPASPAFTLRSEDFATAKDTT